MSATARAGAGALSWAPREAGRVSLKHPTLFPMPLCGLELITVADANDLLLAWGHRLGPIHRPFTQQAFALEVDGQPVSVAVSASVVSATVGGFQRTEVVECARLCSDPEQAWASRIMLRLWREVCGPRWPDWEPKAAISYSQNAHHRGDLYRLDGWLKVSRDAGSSGGGAWSRKRYASDAVYGKKTLWIWPYGEANRAVWTRCAETGLFVRTEAPILTSAIAVPTEDAYDRRKSKNPQLSVERVPSYVVPNKFNPVRDPVVVRVIQSQEFESGLSAASATSAVSSKGFTSQLRDVAFMLNPLLAFRKAMHPLHVIGRVALSALIAEGLAILRGLLAAQHTYTSRLTFCSNAVHSLTLLLGLYWHDLCTCTDKLVSTLYLSCHRCRVRQENSMDLEILI